MFPLREAQFKKLQPISRLGNRRLSKQSKGREDGMHKAPVRCRTKRRVTIPRLECSDFALVSASVKGWFLCRTQGGAKGQLNA